MEIVIVGGHDGKFHISEDGGNGCICGANLLASRPMTHEEFKTSKHKCVPCERLHEEATMTWEG